MLKNITVLEKIKPIESLQDNSKFQEQLKLLAPFFQFDFANGSQEDRETFFYNLLYVAQKDLSLAHCIQHNHKARLAIECGPDSVAKDLLKNSKYHEVICSYSSQRAVDTIEYDPVTNTLTPGVKGWLSNLKSADICVIEVAEVNTSGTSSAHRTHSDESGPNVYTVFVDLRKVNHSRTDGSESPTAVGMKGAAPGTLTLNESLPVGNDVCYMLKENPRRDLSYPWLSYVRQCWATVHCGVILGLYKELMTYPELQDPALTHRLRTLELEISTIKIMWEQGLETIFLNSRTNHNPVMTTTQTHQMRNTQYAMSKKVLLDLIHLVLEVGLNQFVDDTTPTWIRFKDAITYSTHMTSLYRCNSKYKNYNNFF